MIPICIVYFANIWTSVLVPIWTWWVNTWKQCTQQSCNWWCLCCNKWFCWVVLIIVATVILVPTSLFLIVLGGVICFSVMITIILCGILICIPNAFFMLWVGHSKLTWSELYNQCLSFCIGSNKTPSGSGTTTPTMFTIGGSLNTLCQGEVELTLNPQGQPSQTQTFPSGSFTFAQPVPNGTKYEVTALDIPPCRCNVTNPSGTVTGANITNVQVFCSPNNK
ncbi:MAG TPA: hypothetical protein VND66_10890 [Acidobacteriaceae bacterium]|nr:hypothetical protein [Acidobacteriaceae bacterium]